jgi:hypothetical protein
MSEGHEVFLDRDLRDGIPVSEQWERRLHERLRWADAVLCVVISAYLGSVWCSAEVGIALWPGIPAPVPVSYPIGRWPLTRAMASCWTCPRRLIG